MIHIQSVGGLGNQLFIYAAARAIQLDTGEEIAIYDYHRESNPLTRRTSEKMVPKLESIHYVDLKPTSPAVFKKTAPVRSFLYLSIHKIYRTLFHVTSDSAYHKMYCKLQPIWNRLGFCLSGLGYIPFRRYHWPRDYFLIGYFFSRRYWGNHSEEIREELYHPELISDRNTALAEEMRSCNAVAVHIRLGDYVDNPYFRNFLYVCSPEYYRDAVAAAYRDLNDPVFYVFTNDREKAMQFPFPAEAKLVFVPEGNSAVEDLQLMAQCKHFIVSNSTFSWWGQFLSTNPNKKVYSPDQWYRDDRPADFYEEDWVKIRITLPEL